ncbi:helix-turn-helix domain-containing protein [Sinomicrobium weinanense]|uniref:Helix-turn-helix transcriptional regulator n=1 Tax=Sinomicrobium weinanense TaxID=2842200 RepID=A0A926Q3S0_9FLAO|nr:helix-turn-helix transcriptional regulator [Sinomicrobium weinanense]MBC9797872.1 helix-turn-helix transcriptional regulator [Sinomicrobium weinanense]MBU3122228.1 helix-turn-helix domain-containing protein [Sinomicrobium weinanense]
MNVLCKHTILKRHYASLFASKIILSIKKKKKEFLIQFAKRLGQLKETKKLSFRDIAENCDLDASFISKIEKGTENITLETVLNLLYGLNIQPKELFDFHFELKNDDIRT